MRVKFRVSLGSDDARAFGLNAKDCVKGATVDVAPEQERALKKKYPGLFEEDVRAVAKKPEITAPARFDSK